VGVSEQRKTVRIQPFVAPCRVVANERALSGYLTDLSEAGARVTCEAEPPAPQTAVTLELRIGRVAARSRLQARVEWARPQEGGSVFGLSFAGLPGEERAALKAVVAEFQRMASEIAS
jgi:hypothetical protein